MAKTSPSVVEQSVKELVKRRQELSREIEEIDRLFDRIGVDAERVKTTGGRGGPGRPKGATKKTTKKKTTKKKTKKTKKRGKRKRGRFDVTAEESILNFVKKAGKPTTAEINAHWQQEGRGGKADNTLTKMVKAGQLKRVPTPGERGSRYTVA